MKYDWSKVSRDTLQRIAIDAHNWEPALRARGMAASLIREVERARFEGLVRPPRTRVVIDKEIADITRAHVDLGNLCHRFPVDAAQRLEALCAEPIANDEPVIDAEFPETDPNCPDCGHHLARFAGGPGASGWFCVKCDGER